jgi:ABC-type transporter Mla MlaB component
VSTKAPKRKRASGVIRDAAPVAAVAMDVAELQAADTATLAILTPAVMDAAMVDTAMEAAAPAAQDGAADATAIMETGLIADLAHGCPLDPIIALPSNSTVKDATVLKTELMKLLDLPAPVMIDVRSVERVDTATIQLLYAFVRDRAERNGMVEWLGSPPALIEAIRLLGVQQVLALPAAGAA